MAYTRVNWEDLPSTDTPINATNLNKMDEGIYDNSLNTAYSTSEIIVGTWVDGKPIYRKTINAGTVPSTGTSISHNINDLSRVIKLYGSGRDTSSSKWRQFPTPLSATTYLRVGVGVSEIFFELGTSNYDWTDVYVTIEYTKTTD